ncbi:hypothetical protein DRN97_09760, partial [Methanosarcinales archaeon]
TSLITPILKSRVYCLLLFILHPFVIFSYFLTWCLLLGVHPTSAEYLLQAGNYKLDIEMMKPEGSIKIQKAFQILIQ